MAAPIGARFAKRPLDKWSMREKLSLASSVRRSGDQNWVSVSRAIKPFGENNRIPDWFSQKNCALQYADLLEKAETPKRKRGEKGSEREVVETPVNQIVRKLTIERIEELKQLIQEEEQKYKKLKKEVEAIRSGRHDNHLDEIWNQIQTEKQIAEEKRKEEEKKLEEEAAERAKAQAARKSLTLPRPSGSVSSVSEVDESTQDSITDAVNVETTDDEMAPVAITVEIPTAQSQDNTPKPPIPPTSPLLSYMLQSKQTSVDSLHKIKSEVEAGQALKQSLAANQKQEVKQEVSPAKQQIQITTAIPPVVFTSTSTSTTQTKPEVMEPVLIPEVKTEIDVVSEDQVMEVDPINIKEEVVFVPEIPVAEEEIEVSTHESPVKLPPQPIPAIATLEQPEVTEVTTTIPAAPIVTVVEEKPVVKEEPPSPASSVSSRISESGSKTSGRRSKGGRGSTGARRGGARVTRRSGQGDDQSSRASDKASDGETSDDDSSVVVVPSGMSALSESIPNSPLSHGSDTEDDKAYKTWKKSIMWVWRAAANHKYANVFLHPVTDDIAPGYSTVVRRPKDLTVIKKHIENGTIRTTSEFQRDMMLMFTNAIMYNNADHDVYKMAAEMYNDVMEHIEQYVNTQIMVQNADSKLLRASRRNESSDKEEESRRRRTSSEAEGGKSKKRKARGDD